MTWLVIGLAGGAGITGVIAAHYWYQASAIDFSPGWYSRPSRPSEVGGFHSSSGYTAETASYLSSGNYQASRQYQLRSDYGLGGAGGGGGLGAGGAGSAFDGAEDDREVISGAMMILRKSSTLNKKAALWTAASVLLGAASSIAGVFH